MNESISNALLIDLVVKFRCGDDFSFLEIYNVFEKLIDKYAHQCEDWKQELTLFLIQLLKTINLSKFTPDDSNFLQRYIRTSLKHRYLTIIKEHQIDTQRRDGMDFADRVSHIPCVDCFNRVDSQLEAALKCLTASQRDVIIYHYFYKFSIAEIGAILNMSRQNVNQLKNRGLKILKNYYRGDNNAR